MRTLVAALAVAATLLAPVPAQAKQAPVLTVTAAPDASYPQEVTLNGETEDIGFNVETTEATTVTVTASGTGLTATPNQPQAIATYGGYVRVAVTATTPGMHTLSVTFSAPGAAPVAVTFPYVFAEGSPLPPSGGSLAGRAYGWQGSESYMEGSARAVNLLSFVNATYAYVGVPPAGQPTCKSAGKGCYPYSYDPATGVFEVGGDIVGKVLGDGVATDGWIVADEQRPELFASYTASDPLTYAARGTRLSGAWHFRDDSYPVGIWAQSVTFRKDRTYELFYQVGDKDERHKFSGTYAVTRTGKVVLKSRGRVVQVGTLALAGAKVGTPKPRKLGLWLVLSGPKGKHGDGNLLAPVKRR